jgi:3-methyladenine DNA glycosylase AlkD
MADSETKAYLLLREALKAKINPGFGKSRERIIGGNYNSWGVPIKIVRELVRDNYAKYGKLYSQSENLETSFCLLSNNTFECKFAGILWLGLVAQDGIIKFEEIEERIFENIDNWALVDTLASDVFSVSIRRNPQTISLIDRWVDSENKWKRRCAIVTAVKSSKYIEDWLALSNSILKRLENESEPIVQKALVWLKKEIKKKLRIKK